MVSSSYVPPLLPLLAVPAPPPPPPPADPAPHDHQARGAAYSMPIAGWFRLTFTLRSDYFEIGLQRLETALGLSPTVSVDLVRSMSGEGVVENGGEVGLANFSL